MRESVRFMIPILLHPLLLPCLPIPNFFLTSNKNHLIFLSLFSFFSFFFLCCLSWKLILLQPLYLQGHQLGTILTHNTAYIQKDIAITIAMAISPPKPFS